MTMAQQVLVAGVGMIGTSKMEKLAYKNETRLGSSCQRSEAEYREVTANVSRNGANAIIVEGTPEARTNRALIANLIGAARLPAIHTEPLGKRACRGSISPSRHGRKIRSAASTWPTAPREVRGVGRLSKYTISFDSYRLNIRDTVALRERQTISAEVG
jgi:hypothetical protein